MHNEYLGKLMETGVNAIVNTVIAASLPPKDPVREFITATVKWNNALAKADNAFVSTSVEDIRKAKTNGKVGVIYGTQDAQFLEDPSWVAVFHKLGFRICQLTYQGRNLIGDGCGERHPSGLSKHGVRVVEEMNRVGVVVDLAHVGTPTTLDAIEVSKNPVILSHTTVRALTLPTVVRSKTDEDIKAMAEKGGVIGISPKSNWLKPKGAKAGTTFEDYMDHIDYVVDLVGIDHIGIGLDVHNGRPHGGYVTPDGIYTGAYSGPGGPYPEIGIMTPGDPPENLHAKGLNPPYPQVLNITKAAVARGYSDQEIEKILGGNFLRVFEKVWK
jgi:microsomal dipeptidase-like Zn-dependent dipeptidase